MSTVTASITESNVFNRTFINFNFFHISSHLLERFDFDILLFDIALCQSWMLSDLHRHLQWWSLFYFAFHIVPIICIFLVHLLPYTLSFHFWQRVQPQRIDSEGPYRLLYCSGKGDRNGVLQELENGVEPNLGDYDKRTALHLASCEGCTEIVVLLLEKGADVNSLDRWGRTVSYINCPPIILLAS